MKIFVVSLYGQYESSQKFVAVISGAEGEQVALSAEEPSEQPGKSEAVI